MLNYDSLNLNNGLRMRCHVGAWVRNSSVLPLIAASIRLWMSLPDFLLISVPFRRLTPRLLAGRLRGDGSSTGYGVNKKPADLSVSRAFVCLVAGA